jgi:ribosomal protein S21
MSNQVYAGNPKTAHVKVKGNGMNIDTMLKIFKRKVKESGILEQYKAKTEYIKPSKVRSDKKNAAKKRQRKLDREQI